MLVRRLFVIVFLKIVDALVDCKPDEYCAVPIGETFRVSVNKSKEDPFDCSESLQWYFNYPNTTLTNGSNDFNMDCSNNTARLQKKNATLSDSGKYGFEFDKQRQRVHPSGEVVIFSATLKTQPKEDGKHHGVLLQLHLPPPPPLKESPKLDITWFHCPSAKTAVPRYMKDSQWRLLDVGLGDESELCCNFNVTNGIRTWQYSINGTHVAASEISLCQSTKTTQTSTSPGTSGTGSIAQVTVLSNSTQSTVVVPGGSGGSAAHTQPGLAVSQHIKLLSTAVTTIIVNSVFHFV